MPYARSAALKKKKEREREREYDGRVPSMEQWVKNPVKVPSPVQYNGLKELALLQL